METFKLILELLYYLSGITLTIIAILGLRQITVAKQISQIASKREAYTLAAERCNYYFEKIIPEINKMDSLIREHKILYFQNSTVKIEGESIIMTPYLEDNALRLSMDMCMDNILIVSNLLEGFSTYFVSGVASEEIAFNTVGRTFVNSVKGYLPYYIPFSETGSYKHTLKLFLSWHNRIESERLQREKEVIDRKLDKSKTMTIKPIGTE